MSWRCGGQTNAELIFNLKNLGIIHDARIKEARVFLDPHTQSVQKIFP